MGSPLPVLKRTAATVVGYLVVAIVAYWLLGTVIGTIRWVARGAIFVALLVGLVAIYGRLKKPGK